MAKDGISLINDLKNLKSKLETMNKDIIFQTTNIGHRDNCYDEMKQNMSNVLEANKNKSDKIRINCGGKLFTTTKSTFLNAKKSLFEAIALDQEIDLSQELFFDRSPFYFQIILDFIRSGEINYKLLKKSQKKVLFEEAKFYQILEIIDYLEERMKEIEFVSFEYSGPYNYKGKSAGTNILEDIKNESLSEGAICANSPGVITIKLNSDWEFCELLIGGYDGDSKLWYKENGAGAQILTSEDGKEFTKVGKIPSGYGKEIKTVKLTKSVGRYIRFQHNSFLGIAYLKIKKMDEEEEQK